MPIWPFGRKNSRRKGRPWLKTSATEPMMKRAGSQRETGRQNGSENVGGDIVRTRTGRERRMRSRESKKLQRNPQRRNYSFSPGRSESLRIGRDGRSEHPPLPDSAAAMVARSTFGANGVWDYRRQDDNIGRVPTLHKRTAQDLNRRKSSKKRKEEDNDRAAEIKAMSKYMPTPTRAATAPDWSGSPIRRDTKRLHGLNRLFTSATSDVSLPLQDSLRSSMSSDSERYAAYELKGMDLFAPRPTIRYSENPKFKQYESGITVQRSNSKRKRALENVPLPEEKPASRKRIDELADDLDAKALRELMERDNRRRELKKIAEREKVAQNVARRKEKQKADEDDALIRGSEAAKVMDRGVMGRELMGLGIGARESPEAARRESMESSKRSEVIADTGHGNPEIPPQDRHVDIPVIGSLPGSPELALESPVSEQEEPILATAQVARLSRATMSPPPSLRASNHQRNASSISQINDLPPKVPEAPTAIPPVEYHPADNSKQDASRESFDTGSSTKQYSSWRSWFKRSSKEKRSSAQSSFSNTTRESTISPPPATVIYALPVAPPGSKRTVSRFREDLPELPISPPYSRIQSPEESMARSEPIETAHPRNNTSELGAVNSYSAQTKHDGTSGNRSHLRYEALVRGHHSTDVPSPEPSNVLSQSLASIDSEGSWLSGRARASSKRSSRQIPLSQSRDSHSSLMKRYKELSDSAEELGIAEDEYFSRLSPGPDDMYSRQNMANRVSGNPMPSSDEEDGESLGSPVSKESKWGDVARTPTVVHRETRAASRQGTLNDFLDDDSGNEKDSSPLAAHKGDEDSETAESPVTPVETPLQRATSVDYKKAHMRHISAGSAKLLELKPRPSGESKRVSIS